MSVNLGFYTAFARFVRHRFGELPQGLKDDFLLDLLGILDALAPVLDDVPRKRTLGAFFAFITTHRDPLSPVRERMRAFQTRWGKEGSLPLA